MSCLEIKTFQSPLGLMFFSWFCCLVWSKNVDTGVNCMQPIYVSGGDMILRDDWSREFV